MDQLHYFFFHFGSFKKKLNLQILKEKKILKILWKLVQSMTAMCSLLVENRDLIQLLMELRPYFAN